MKELSSANLLLKLFPQGVKKHKFFATWIFPCTSNFYYNPADKQYTKL